MTDIVWRPGSRPELERASWRTPGYDCRSTCEHEHKGKHGWHADEWHFSVRTADGVVSLTVYSSEFADRPHLTEEYRASADGYFALSRGADLSRHTPYPVHEHEIKHGTTPCDLMPPACYCDGTSLGAEAFWRAHGNDGSGVDQGEAFWLALEERAVSMLEDARASRTHKILCPTCKGEGVASLA